MARKKNKNQIDKSTQAIDENLLEALNHFIEFHPPERMSRNLRKMLVEFLQYQGATEAVYLNDLLYDLEGLFHVLDVASDARE